MVRCSEWEIGKQNLNSGLFLFYADIIDNHSGSKNSEFKTVCDLNEVHTTQPMKRLWSSQWHYDFNCSWWELQGIFACPSYCEEHS